MAFDTTSPLQSHNAYSDMAAMRENFRVLRNLEAGASEPANLVAGILWLDTSTSPYTMRQRNSTNTGWLTLWTFGTIPVQTPSGCEQGDILIRDGSGWIRLAHGTSGQVLVTAGHGANPAWGSAGAGSVKQSSLATSYGEVGGYDGNYTLPGGMYGFYPQVKSIGTGSLNASISVNLVNTSYSTNINLYSGGDTSYAIQRYVTASGTAHWLFAVVQKSTGKIIMGYSAPDHPCFGNGDDPLLVPHPFPDFFKKGLPEGLEIAILDIEDTDKIKAEGLAKITDSVLVDVAKEVSFKPRDMDGKNMLAEKHSSYTTRKIKVA